MKRSRRQSALKLGRETYGPRTPDGAFADALTSYFAKVKPSHAELVKQDGRRQQES